MARHWFGQSLTDWTFTVGAGGEAVLAGGVEIIFWSQPVGGSRYTDLLDESGAPITSVVSSDGSRLPIGTIPRFQGPPDVTAMWAEAGAGTRWLMVAADLWALEGQVAALASEVDGMAGAVSSLATVARTGEYDDLIGAPTLAAVATSGAYSDLSGAPAPGLQIVTKVGATWPVRASTAPDTSRVAAWVGPPPAPPAGGGYALPGDLWWPTP